MLPTPTPRADWRSRYGLRSRLGWALLAVVVLAGVYELFGLLYPSLPGAVGVSPRPSVTSRAPAVTVSPTASPRPVAPSPAPGQTSPSTTQDPRVIVVQPQRGDRGPAGEPGAVIIVRSPSSPSPAPSSPSPSPSPTRACTVTVAGRCVVPGLSP